MRIIFSRKGFDSGYGGVPSPILPDGRMVSLPIPGGRAPHRFDEITGPSGPVGALAAHLSKRPALARAAAHLDPDLDSGSLPRKPGWRASLGQVGAAQSHLAGQGVGPGDLFLFFGWFRETEEGEEGLRYRRGSPQQHVLFGYLQIGEVLHLGGRPDVEGLLEKRPWLHDHPHLDGERSENNTLYLASDELILPSGPTGRPGAGAFDRLRPNQVLTAPGKSKSMWRMPAWLEQAKPSYHGDERRWSKMEQGVLLKTVAKGQEFVTQCPNTKDVEEWILDVTSSPLRGAKPPKGPCSKQRRRLR